MTYILKTANLILIGIIVFFGVQIFYGAITTKFDRVFVPEKQDTGPTEHKAESRRSASDYRIITQRNLFRTKESASEKKDDSLIIDAIKPTTLKLKLWGTIINEGGISYAVIEDMKEKKQDLYRPDDQIQNAKVKKILREKVVLRIGNKDEILEMEKRTAGSKKDARSSDGFGMEKSRSITLGRSTVDNAVKDINNLMKQVKIRPHPDGLSLTGIVRNSIFSKMGLKNGDVIVGLDGRDIQSVDDALELYDNLRSASNVSVRIKRRGRYENIDYNIE